MGAAGDFAGCGFEISSDPEEADVQIVRLKL